MRQLAVFTPIPLSQTPAVRIIKHSAVIRPQPYALSDNDGLTSLGNYQRPDHFSHKQ